MVRKLALVTASVFALGLAGSGPGLAAAANSTANPSPRNVQSQTPNAPYMQNQAQSAAMTQGTQAQTAPVKLSQRQVKQVQQQLKTAGLYNGAIDGKIGPKTKQAVSEFQQQNGLTQTGTVDRQTMAAMNNGQNTANQNNFGSSSGTALPPSAGNIDRPSAQTGNTPGNTR